MKKINKDSGNRLVLEGESTNIEEVKGIMKMRKNWWLRMNRELITVLALTFALLMAASAVQAGCPATNSTADTDKDGLSDGLECAGITLPVSGLVPYCGDSVGGPVGCLHPDIPDLFVVIERANTSNLPAGNILQYLTLVTAHEIDKEDVSTTYVIPGTDPVQKALVIVEVSEAGAGGGYLGELPWGNLPNTITGYIYTQDIVDYVTSKGGTLAHAETYMQYVLAHEFGHGMRLAPKYNSRYDGYHYSIRDDVVMQENAVVSTKGGSAPSFYFPADWGTDSEAAYKLK
jgi:hypothetical protein